MHILDESSYKTNKKQVLTRVLYEATISDTIDEVVSKVIQQHLSIRREVGPVTKHSAYLSSRGSNLHEDFFIAEVAQATFSLNRVCTGLGQSQ